MLLSDSVLVESKSARDNQLERVSHDHAQSALAKVKAVYFALWQGTGAATSEQMRDFFKVNIDAVEAALRRCRGEFELDGLRVIKGKQLKDFKQLSASKAESSNAASLTIWTPRAALRLGMVLQESAVAKAVRTSLLDAAEAIPTTVDKVRELELQLAIAQAQREAAQANAVTVTTQERLTPTSQAIATLHGSGMVALILGKPEAVVERVTEVEKTVLVNQSGKPIATYKGLSKTKLAKRYGLKRAADLVNWLESIGRADLLQPGITAAPCQYIPFESLSELDRLWAARQGSRQRLLGE